MTTSKAVDRMLAVLALVLALFAVAPSTGLATAPAPDTAGEASPATQAPDTTPATAPASTTPDGGGGDDDVPWPLIIAGAAVLIALIALIASISRRKPPPSHTTAQPTTGSAAHHDQVAQERGYALGSAQWVHDNFTIELLAAAPDAALRRWNTDRARLDDATIRAQRFSAEPQHGLAWQSLAQSLSLVGASMETLIQLRNADQPDDRLIAEATDVVQRHRAQLANDIATLWPTLRS